MKKKLYNISIFIDEILKYSLLFKIRPFICYSLTSFKDFLVHCVNNILYSLVDFNHSSSTFAEAML